MNLLLTATTFNDAVGLHDGGIVSESWVFCVTGHQWVHLLLFVCYKTTFEGGKWTNAEEWISTWIIRSQPLTQHTEVESN